MTEASFLNWFMGAWLVLAAIVFLSLFFVPAPYGRHGRGGWGPTLPARLAWMLMEAPAPLGFLAFFLLGERGFDPASVAFLVLWQVHYVNRTFVYPLRLAPDSRPVPFSIVAMGFVFNIGNAYLNGRYLFSLAPAYPADWLLDPRFLLGLALFAAGLVINHHADAVLRRLRAAGGGYRIPYGGLYRFISAPNYFGELVEWVGFAVLTWSLPATVFVLWTAANLVPRAYTHHRWYRAQFPDYPPERKAVFPFVF